MTTIHRIKMSSGSRSCRIGRSQHGLGAVGEPLRPFLHHRHADGVEDGHDLTLPDDLRDLVVVEVDFAAKPYASGRFPVVRRPLAALGAEDVRLPEVDA